MGEMEPTLYVSGQNQPRNENKRFKKDRSQYLYKPSLYQPVEKGEIPKSLAACSRDRKGRKKRIVVPTNPKYVYKNRCRSNGMFFPQNMTQEEGQKHLDTNETEAAKYERENRERGQKMVIYCSTFTPRTTKYYAELMKHFSGFYEDLPSKYKRLNPPRYIFTSTNELRSLFKVRVEIDTPPVPNIVKKAVNGHVIQIRVYPKTRQLSHVQEVEDQDVDGPTAEQNVVECTCDPAWFPDLEEPDIGNPSLLPDMESRSHRTSSSSQRSSLNGIESFLDDIIANNLELPKDSQLEFNECRNNVWPKESIVALLEQSGDRRFSGKRWSGSSSASSKASVVSFDLDVFCQANQEFNGAAIQPSDNNISLQSSTEEWFFEFLDSNGSECGACTQDPSTADKLDTTCSAATEELAYPASVAEPFETEDYRNTLAYQQFFENCHIRHRRPQTLNLNDLKRIQNEPAYVNIWEVIKVKALRYYSEERTWLPGRVWTDVQNAVIAANLPQFYSLPLCGECKACVVHTQGQVENVCCRTVEASPQTCKCLKYKDFFFLGHRGPPSFKVAERLYSSKEISSKDVTVFNNYIKSRITPYIGLRKEEFIGCVPQYLTQSKFL